MIGSLDPAKILVVLVIALIVLGPERLPRAARTLGAWWHEFSRIRQEVSDEVRSALPSSEDLPSIPRIPSVRGGLSRYLTEPLSGEGSANGGEETPAGVDGVRSFGEVSPAADDPSMN